MIHTTDSEAKLVELSSQQNTSFSSFQTVPLDWRIFIPQLSHIREIQYTPSTFSLFMLNKFCREELYEKNTHPRRTRVLCCPFMAYDTLPSYLLIAGTSTVYLHNLLPLLRHLPLSLSSALISCIVSSVHPSSILEERLTGMRRAVPCCEVNMPVFVGLDRMLTTYKLYWLEKTREDIKKLN